MHARSRNLALAFASLCAFAALFAAMHERWLVAGVQTVWTVVALGYWRWNLYWWGKASFPPAPARQRAQPKPLQEAPAERDPAAPEPGRHPVVYYGVRCDTCDEVTFVGLAPAGEGYVPEVVCEGCGATTVTRPDNIWWTYLGPEARSGMKH